MNKRIIVALDYPHQKAAMALVNRLDPQLCRLKVGKELFVATGRNFVEQLVSKGFDVFLDLKFYDIPNTVASVLKVVADMGVWMVNVHASGGQKMLDASVVALQSQQGRKPLLIAVTVLTSMSDKDLQAMGISQTAEQQVLKLATMAYTSGLDGVVCSAQEAAAVKAHTAASFVTVTPGIRPAGSSKDDQSRIMTPEKAVISGADYLVIGRPVTQADDPVAVIREINRKINGTEGRT